MFLNTMLKKKPIFQVWQVKCWSSAVKTITVHQRCTRERMLEECKKTQYMSRKDADFMLDRGSRDAETDVAHSRNRGEA